MKHIQVASIIVLMLLVACNKDDRDPLDPRLYEYSDEGKDIASCLINDEVWRKKPISWSPYESYGSIRVFSDTIEERSKFILGGSMISSGIDVEIIFYLNGVVIRNYSDLSALEGTGFTLNDESGRGQLSFGQGMGIPACPDEAITSEGMFYIRNVSSFVNSNGNRRYICSGTFGFDYTSPCWSYEVYHGRYDCFFSDIIFL
jgi:hypothetical protein